MTRKLSLPLRPKRIRDGLGDEDAKHNRLGVREGVCQLEHDHRH